MGVGVMPSQSQNSQSQLALLIATGLIVLTPTTWAVLALRPAAKESTSASQVSRLIAENHELRRRVELCEKTHYQAPTLVGGGR
jgi:hypothetical protein